MRSPERAASRPNAYTDVVADVCLPPHLLAPEALPPVISQETIYKSGWRILGVKAAWRFQAQTSRYPPFQSCPQWNHLLWLARLVFGSPPITSPILFPPAAAVMVFSDFGSSHSSINTLVAPNVLCTDIHLSLACRSHPWAYTCLWCLV